MVIRFGVIFDVLPNLPASGGLKWSSGEDRLQYSYSHTVVIKLVGFAKLFF